jgi:hypothetical protein
VNLSRLHARQPAPRPPQPDVAHAAAHYTTLGWPVLPFHGITTAGACTCPAGWSCDRPGKHPPRKGYAAMATTDAEIARSYFALVPYNLVLQVPAWLIVIDADDAAALAHLRRWAPWPVAPTQYTRRGLHQVYRWPLGGPSPSVGGLDGQHLDIKGAGEHVHLAPSRRTDGKRYEWGPGLSPFEHPTPVLPEAFAVHVQRAAAARATARRPTSPAADLTTLAGAVTLAHKRATYAQRQSNGAGRGRAGLRRTLEEAGTAPDIIHAALAAFDAAAR